MDVDTLELFLEVVRRGSFAAVARERGVAASSVSRAIAGLEDALGARLVQRSTRGLSPTEAGARYAARVTPLLAELRDATDALRDTQQAPRGVLRVTGPLTFSQLHVIPHLPELAERHPELRFEILLGDRLVDLVAERIDVAIRLANPGDASLIGTRLAPMVYALTASPAYLAARGTPASPEALREHDCLRYPVTGQAARWRFRSGPEAEVVEVPIAGRFVVGNGLALRQLAVAGLGITLLPRWNVAGELARGELVEVLPELEVTASRFGLSAWALYPSRDHLPAKVRVFVDFLREKLATL
ncbi:MAG: LysR family transcriptional regulator [Myxococcota bacterium]